MDELYASIAGVSDIHIININTSHGSPVSTATVEAGSHTLNLGDLVQIDLGYSTNHEVVFRGYVKNIAYNVPNRTWQITINDPMIRAADYFIVSNSPDNALKKQNITAEDLVRDIMALAGLTSFSYDATFFTFGIQDAFEINLVSSADYCRVIADLLTWHIWASIDGTINFKNRKPYVMDGLSGQPGDSADTPVGDTIEEAIAIDYGYREDANDLRNKVVVYGKNLSATAQAESPYLPDDFYKAAVLADAQLIDDQTVAQNIADYNLQRLNRLTKVLNCTIVGDTQYQARTVVPVNLTVVSGNGYIYTCEHSWSAAGFTTNLDIRM